MSNNFDKSSSGTDIEFVGMLDGDMMRREFDDNIEILQHSGYSIISKGYYIDNGNVPQAHEIKFSIKGKRAAMEKYLLEQINSGIEVKKMKVPELQDEILASLDKITLVNYEEESESLAKFDLEIAPDKDIEKIEIHGYCQGDYAEVFYCPSDLESVWGNKPDAANLKEMFTHYYYDAPVYANFTINGEEYSYWDMPDYDSYEWERDKFLAYVSKESGVAVEQLAPLVPEYLEYAG